MKSGRSQVIGIIHVDPAVWSRGGHEALMMVEGPNRRGASATRAASRPPLPPTTELEANLASLFVELNDELTALNRRLQCAIASADA
jgi:hypothetical protein